VRKRLLELIARLRELGITISVAETIDAIRAVEVAGVERPALREALAATLVKHEDDRAAFEAAFEDFFAAPAPEGGGRTRKRAARTASAGSGSGAPSGGSSAGGSMRAASPERETKDPGPVASPPTRNPGQRDSERPAAVRADRPAPEPPDRGASSPRRDRGDGREAKGAAVRPRGGRGEAFLNLSFQSMEPDELERAYEVARELGTRIAARSSRRERRRRRGRIDIRRTIRTSLARGGVPIDLERRGRRPGKPDLVLLCDVSGSVAAASELLLAILASAESAFRRVHRFAFVDRPVEVALLGRHIAPAAPLDLYARSDFGGVLRVLTEEHPTLFDAATVVLVLGDARNNRLPARADLLRRLSTRTRALVWAVAEPRARWYGGDSALAAYEPYCATVCEATSLAGLKASLHEALRR
jgi:uncharacterized protein